MLLIIIFLSVWIFIKTISYSIYEIKENKNYLGGFMSVFIAIIALIMPIYAILTE